ncbi:MAG TPA: geranylgeranylglyceryl/heptaprenylglyceryl phosphate synthase [Bacteroidales bacterium]|jgi:putative glycerol-1-phosphate prenyltransferase|nr:geranylgeranylglyceryl/heptaprenylglyceryl phosphate synthase [Bacteroidales bacterium]
MNYPLYNRFFSDKEKVFALLIDPEKQTELSLKKTIEAAEQSFADMILVGGSLTSCPIDDTILSIKKITEIPVVLFPGNLLQLSIYADGILLMSLISGRNPEYLIGNQVMASMYLKRSGLEIIPTGYILTGGSSFSSVEYMSNTRPIPSDKTDIIAATALAGEQLGMKLVYLEAGSGSNGTVATEVIARVKNEINIPIMAGGGIKTPDDVRKLYKSGAKAVVVGTAVELDHSILKSLASVKKEF